ncbi:serine palmitoyltransferase 1 [Malaya genurostris]|uniref:serine palmitoyltransferase 1 n=1 Tax=Malaya genurostris TaxID=325434 RepID=UPI0026F37E99|nr:serine palmitoyltransferase 1 [Malaya genurostris]XP_058461880.1 serine palmitoyltransferase 1 [Malaya genurostris]XP_058461881.1 serine palmitoyltransferase 1 [Malaya genurostris]XP_058461882.1 serine palmitoyltransferase 1 [Malaya genurostris]
MVTTPYIINEIYDIIQKSTAFELTLEALLALGVIWIVFYKRANARREKPLSVEQRAKLIEEWVPEPLVGDVPANHPSLHTHVVYGRVGKVINIDGKQCLNLASHNYLGLLGDKHVEQAAVKSLRKYGVGSCGPRGFYGTVDVHLELEERLAKFMQVEEAVVYSYAFSTIASAIPAYSKRGDIIFVDEFVNFAIQKGLDASRSKIVFFKHNDVTDLERLLEEQATEDRRNVKKAMKRRRFLVAEAIYMNTGELCPLPQLVELRKRYKLRMFLDESISFGVLGKNGRGLVEHFNIDKTEVDLRSAGLEWAAGTIGGFCAGSSFIVEHQRLSGLGYCFSASLPPLLTQAAICALDKFESEPSIFDELRECCRKVSQKLPSLEDFTFRGDLLSPVKHLYLKNETDFRKEKFLLDQISKECIDTGLAVITPEYLDHMEKNNPRPSIRLTVNRLLTDADIDDAFRILQQVARRVLATA